MPYQQQKDYIMKIKNQFQNSRNNENISDKYPD